jgi:primase-polymerase (primpol)-like protein
MTILHSDEHGAMYLSDLAHKRTWVGWREETRDGRKTRVPIDPITAARARSDNPQTWASRGEAETWVVCNAGAGVGLMFTAIEEGLHLGGIDLDTCRDPETGHIEAWADDIIRRFKTYAEISPSGTGVKLFFTAAPRRQQREAIQTAWRRTPPSDRALYRAPLFRRHR